MLTPVPPTQWKFVQETVQGRPQREWGGGDQPEADRVEMLEPGFTRRKNFPVGDGRASQVKETAEAKALSHKPRLECRECQREGKQEGKMGWKSLSIHAKDLILKATRGQKRIQALAAMILFFSFFCLFFRVAPVAYGDSQARGQIGAAAAGLHHSSQQHGIQAVSATYTTVCGNAGS